MQKGQTVTWDWGQGTASGEVVDRFTRKVTRTLKGSEVTRDGSGKDAALLIRQDDGDEVLKLESEVRKG